jgi:hypothetical protein
VGSLAPAIFEYALTLCVGIALLFLSLLFAITVKLRAKLNDVQDAISLENGLRRAGYDVTDFFMDEAAGNPSLQLLHFKILRLCRPQSVLELGSGQTTKLLSCYHRQNPSAFCLTLEQDEKWFLQLKDQITHDYRHVPLEPKHFQVLGKGQTLATSWYREIPELKERKFEYILVDGPDHGVPGTQHVDYARSGILQYMPGLMASKFVVVFDDAERYGEAMTINAFEAMLKITGVRFIRFARHGIKTQAAFCSPEFAFLRSV